MRHGRDSPTLTWGLEEDGVIDSGYTLVRCQICKKPEGKVFRGWAIVCDDCRYELLIADGVIEEE